MIIGADGEHLRDMNDITAAAKEVIARGLGKFLMYEKVRVCH